jgi:hypothetical protein
MSILALSQAVGQNSLRSNTELTFILFEYIPRQYKMGTRRASMGCLFFWFVFFGQTKKMNALAAAKKRRRVYFPQKVLLNLNLTGWFYFLFFPIGKGMLTFKKLINLIQN